MSADFLPVLKAEIGDLEEEIRNDPRYRKLLRLREVLAEYEPKRARTPVTANVRPPVGNPAPPHAREESPPGESAFAEHSRANRSEFLRHLLRSPIHRQRRSSEGRQGGR